MPRDVLVARPRAEEVKSDADVRDLVPPILRRFTSPHDPIPRTHLLSNGRYAVMVTAAGSGYSRWRDVAVTRWREDVDARLVGQLPLPARHRTAARCGRRVTSPAAPRPTPTRSTYSEDHAEFSRRDGSITTGLTIVVSAEHDAEIRRVSLTNLGSRAREIELTSYAEIVLAPQAADVAHPAFQNLFVADRVRAGDRRPAGDSPSAIRRRAADLGRACRGGRGAGRRRHPVRDGPRPLPRPRPVGPLAGLGASTGARCRTPSARCSTRSSACGCRVRLAPGATAHAIFSTVVAESREAGPGPGRQVSRRRRRSSGPAILAWTQAQVQLHHLGIEADEAHLFQRLANRILYSDPSLRPPASAAGQQRARRVGPVGATASPATCPSSWSASTRSDDLDIVRQLLRAHEYWRLKLLDVDLVILNEHGATYVAGPPRLARGRRADEPVDARLTRAIRATAACTSCAATGSPPRTGRCSRRRPGRCC